MRTNLTADYVRARLDYDPDSGSFTWKRKPQNSNQDFLWNCAFAGKRAGSFMANGYYQIRLDGTSYAAHRVAWLYVYGEHPVGLLDHRDRDKANNSIKNLRPATSSQNSFNRSTASNNTSGTKGVVFDGRRQRWIAQIFSHGKLKSLGRFAEKDDAIAARKAAEEKFHGEFSAETGGQI